MITSFSEMSKDSRIWIYQSNRKFIASELEELNSKIVAFLNTWASHGSEMLCSYQIKYDRFIIIALDETKTSASGCSIDTLQNIIQKIEKELIFSLMNRLNVFCKIEDEILCIPSFKLGSVADKDTLFYDLTILTKSDLNTYLKPISEGWCAHLV